MPVQIIEFNLPSYFFFVMKCEYLQIIGCREKKIGSDTRQGEASAREREHRTGGETVGRNDDSKEETATLSQDYALKEEDGSRGENSGGETAPA